MLNRRQLRIKVLHILYSYYMSEDKDMPKFEKDLMFSIQKAHEMYLYLLALIIEMQKVAIERIEAGLQKKLPTQEDLHPNTRFVTNIPLRVLANSKTLGKALEDAKVSWSDNPELVRKVFKILSETEDYNEYMEATERGFDHDRTYLLRFFKKHMINIPDVHDYFEEKSIFWNDDLDLIASMTIKTIKSIKEDDSEVELLEMWRDEDDERGFVEDLFRKTIVHGEENGKLIDENAANWDFDRIAVIDMILMKMALAEATQMQTVPLKVTLNEYIELAKYYSTPKSNGFINGLLDQLFGKLKEDEKIVKLGRGLLDD